MSKSPIIVSFFTENTSYEKDARELRASCNKFGLECDIVSVADLGSWSKNCCHKPQFILEMLEKHNRPVIWVDADSIFNQRPTFFEECYADVALRIHDNLSFDEKDKIVTGTLFFNNTASAKKLLQLWKRECERHLDSDKVVFDQVCLRKVILHYPTIVEMKRLPAAYHVSMDSSDAKNAVLLHKENHEALATAH